MIVRQTKCYILELWKGSHLINSGYGRLSGHSDNQHRAFVQEVTAIFESLGWQVPQQKQTPLAKSGYNRFFLHPCFFTGYINDKKIVQTIMDAAKNAKTFSIYGVEYNYTGKYIRSLISHL